MITACLGLLLVVMFTVVHAGDGCAGSLQSRVDAALPHAVITIPACIFRESVTIDRPLTLRAVDGAEIRGSDVWREWSEREGLWVSQRMVPPLPMVHGVCQPGVARCLWPEQVFVDGAPLLQVDTRPRPGEFALDPERRVLLGEPPAGRLVEVSVRRHWLRGAADGVTIEGFRMRHAANDAQWWGALAVNGHSGWTLRHNTLSDAHGALVSLCSSGGRGNRLLGNTLYRSGWLGVHAHACAGAVVRGNHIAGNNTEGFSADWAAGGIKMATVRDVRFEENVVHDNAGHGLWCDIDCEGTLYAGNRVHGNAGVGIFHEISGEARITGNVVWDNGWRLGGWGTGAGILAQGSRDVEIAGNLVAWNADGIVVVATPRHDQRDHPWNHVRNNVVHGNTIVMRAPAAVPHSIGQYALAWLEQLPWLPRWSGGDLYAPGSGNRGEDNAVWWPVPATQQRFHWRDENHATVAAMAANTGGRGSRWLAEPEVRRLLDARQVPFSPVAAVAAASEPGRGFADRRPGQQ